ncbi:solute carrier family 40 member 1-like [Callorhinchus milii]|uniref:Solute carrier family 40 member n=1 Tax=Callorhinchus milii TaxID=7868 RepID=A0A4W3II96_CALMI|nr:solute carrier family 40 member 1-like [Callorhinchus milii]|eukprot:gi/632945688/ref/XP_007888189.1/ PREDICTED: solute carrier family 40 member 1-like [Callorhinchus milii]
MDFELVEEGPTCSETHESTNKKERINRIASTWKFLHSAQFFLYLAHSLSTWGDRMWHFAVSLFLVELYGNNLLLTAVFGLAISSTLILFGALVGNWVDKNPRMKVVRIALVIQNLSVILCAGGLMLFFSYRTQIIVLWSGWMQVFCYFFIITIGVIAELASTAMSISIQRDWIIVVAEDTDKLSSMNANLRQIDLLSKLLSPMAVGQIMTFSSSEIGCAFIAGWNLFSMCFEYLLLQKVYKITPALAIKNVQQLTNQEEQHEASEENQTSFKESEMVDTPVPEGDGVSSNSRNQNPDKTGGLRSILVPLKTLQSGWIAYYKQPMFLAALGLSFLYMTVLGFDGITIGYAYAQGVSSSVLSIMVALAAVLGLVGTLFFTILRKYCGLVHTGLFSSIAQMACLTLCIASVFAPGSPFDLSVPLHSHASNQVEANAINVYPAFTSNGSVTKPSLQSSNLTSHLPMHLTNSTKEFDYTSIALYFAGAATARIGLWSFDLTVTQLIQEMVHESKRGIVNGVQGSMNAIMDLLRFVLVIIAPAPEHFGFLIILSVIFVSLGGFLYFCFARKTLGKHLHKCVCMKEKGNCSNQVTNVVVESFL